jgi:succinate dehydrogenase / fumarate reductase, cytochrome b subunit
LSTATTASDFSLPLIAGRNHFLLRRLHSLTGILFGGYIIIHLLVNATLAEGGNVFQAQVDKIHSLPFLPAVEWIFIYLPILYHTAYGLYITFTGQPNVPNYPYGKNIFYFIQRVTALALVLFIAFHVLAMKGIFGATSPLTFDPKHATETAIRHLTAWGFIGFLIYLLFIVCACFHLANGFWTAAITWGLTVSAASQRRWGLVCIGIFAFTFICGMTALVAAFAHSATGS